ncbi:hypothetical protein ABZP36_028967 [Zizania latifolia]
MEARGRQIVRSREDMIAFLADFSGGGGGDDGCDRELSFSDLVVETAKPGRDDGGGDSNAAATTTRAPAMEKGPGAGRSESSSSFEQQAAAARERRLRRRRSDSRGSGGGSRDGVLLNFYVPGLRRSMTTPRPGRATLPAAAAPATAAAGKARIDRPPAVGCWPALWCSGGRDCRKTPSKPPARRQNTRAAA